MSEGYLGLKSRRGKARFLEGNMYQVAAGIVVDAVYYYNEAGCTETTVPRPHIALPDGRRWFQARPGIDIAEA